MSIRIEPAIADSPMAGDAVQARRSTTALRLALAALGMGALAGWLLQHPYAGLVHDSSLYTLLALTKLHPDALADDIFLRFGSQDQYTIFSPLYATVIASTGLEHAAELLTFAGHLALFVCAWLLARRFMSPLPAMLGVALLAAMPGEYGSSYYFHYAEGFLTPRLPAEALVLGAIVAASRQRYWRAVACILVAMLLHPIMAAAGAVMLILTFVAPASPKLTLGVAAVLLAASLAVLEAIAPLGRLDDTWLLIVRATSPFLYVSSWSVSDWSRAALPVGILAIGWRTGAAPLLRRLCAGGLVMVACGLAITLTYCDMMHVALFTTLQSWRWLWLAAVIAIVLSPVIGHDCWRCGASGRAAVVLLAGAWVLRGSMTTLCIVPFAIAFSALPAAWSAHRCWRLVFFGSCALLAIALAIDVGDLFSYAPAEDTSSAPFLQQLRAVCSDGVIPGVLLICAGLGLHRSQSVSRNAVLAAATALACAALVPPGVRSWTLTHYTPGLADKFGQWRAGIPLRAEVLWPDTPVGAWYLLERPSYWSPHQFAGAIFSREKSLLMRRRTESITAALAAAHLLGSRASADSDPNQLEVPGGVSKLDRPGMVAACADPDLRYVVSWMHLAPTPFAPVIVDPAKPNGKLYLYRCADLRT